MSSFSHVASLMSSQVLVTHVAVSKRLSSYDPKPYPNPNSQTTQNYNLFKSPTLSQKSLHKRHQRVDIPLLRRILNGPRRVLGKENNRWETPEPELPFRKPFLLLPIRPKLPHPNSRPHQSPRHLIIRPFHRPAKPAPRRVHHNHPSLPPILHSQKILHSGPAQTNHILALKKIRPVRVGPTFQIQTLFFFLDVALVEPTLLGLSILPPPPTLPLVLTWQNRPRARLATDRDVPLRV
ncbi:F-box family protein [Striga asiatica]|uniref:F-box family protein n=1 Tax=Striga asiatica TaxID=4170 RepID=A0A5A7RGD8_STRAF|nr:F-box family protein [Striga asiatica]